MCPKAIIPKTVFIKTKNSIKEYKVLSADNNYYCCISSFTKKAFYTRITKTFPSRDDAKYNTFVEKLKSMEKSKRIDFLARTKQTAYKERYINENPEKLI